MLRAVAWRSWGRRIAACSERRGYAGEGDLEAGGSEAACLIRRSGPGGGERVLC